MKKSAAVRLTLMASMSIVACRQGSDRRCVDWDGKPIVDALCSDSEKTPVPGTSRAYYHWYYSGRPGPGPSSVAPHAASPSGGAQSGVSRGGFGSSAGAHGSSSAGA